MSVFVYVFNKNYWNESRPREYRLPPEAARGWTRTANYDEFFLHKCCIAQNTICYTGF